MGVYAVISNPSSDKPANHSTPDNSSNAINSSTTISFNLSNVTTGLPLHLTEASHGTILSALLSVSGICFLCCCCCFGRFYIIRSLDCLQFLWFCSALKLKHHDEQNLPANHMRETSLDSSGNHSKDVFPQVRKIVHKVNASIEISFSTEHNENEADRLETILQREQMLALQSPRVKQHMMETTRSPYQTAAASAGVPSMWSPPSQALTVSTLPNLRLVGMPAITSSEFVQTKVSSSFAFEDSGQFDG